MTPIEVLDLGRSTTFTLILTSLPLLSVALIVGVAISLLQALTQIQEMTLTFVPKIIAMLLVGVASLPFMGNQLGAYMDLIIQTIERN